MSLEEPVSLMQRALMQILWPAFVTAAFSTGLVFSWLDPSQLVGVPASWADNRYAVYTVGFLLMWVLHCLACAMTWFLAASTSSPKRC